MLEFLKTRNKKQWFLMIAYFSIMLISYFFGVFSLTKVIMYFVIFFFVAFITYIGNF